MVRVILDREPVPSEQPSLFAPGMDAWRAALAWAATQEPPLTVEQWQIDQRFLADVWYEIHWNADCQEWVVRPIA